MGRVTGLNLVLFHDRTPSSRFSSDFSLAAAVPRQITSGGSGFTEEPYECILRANHTLYHAKGPRAAKTCSGDGRALRLLSNSRASPQGLVDDQAGRRCMFGEPRASCVVQGVARSE